jgi:C4-type Zn-finger protein
MKITEITDQHRRDFRANIECENCGAKDKLTSGYDDRNYHDNVIPNMKCKSCGKSRNDLGITAEPTPTKYASWQVV